MLAIKRNDPRYWLWFGVVAGIGLQEKYSIALFGFGIVVGLLLTPQRRVFSNPWIWIGGFAAFLIFLPNLLWNIHNQWPFIQLMHNIRADGRDVVLPLPQFFFQQILLIDLITAPIWIRGLIALFFSQALKPYRVLAWAYLVCFTVFFVLHGKNYYLSPIYPMLLAAGAVSIEAAIERRKIASAEAESVRVGPNRLVWLKPVIIVLLLASGAHLAPLVVPILSPDKFLAYLKYLPMKPPVMEHGHERAPLPQWYSDQFGWEEIVAETAKAYNQIAPAERSGCGIFAQDYGQAGAIDFLGPRYGLPPALSGHQTYWLWGPRGYSGNCLVVLDDTRERLEELFEHVEYVGTSADNPFALEKLDSGLYLPRGEVWVFGKDLAAAEEVEIVGGSESMAAASVAAGTALLCPYDGNREPAVMRKRYRDALRLTSRTQLNFGHDETLTYDLTYFRCDIYFPCAFWARAAAQITLLHDARAEIGAIVSGARGQNRSAGSSVVWRGCGRASFRRAESAGSGDGEAAPRAGDADCGKRRFCAGGFS